MRVAITGASGFIGQALSAAPRRARPRSSPCRRDFSTAEFAETEAVIHLAGESVAGLWTPGKRRRILAQPHREHPPGRRRVHTLAPQVRVLLSASAVGIYGDRPGETLDEGSALDSHVRFRARVCRAWEAEALAASSGVCRVVCLRLWQCPGSLTVDFSADCCRFTAPSTVP